MSEQIKIIPVGGQEQVGLNMMLIEYKDDILVIDLGLDFPGEEEYGIDYILPNTTYLQENRDRICGVLITHGNMDHIGATPYIIEQLGFPKIYTGLLTKRLIQSQLEEFGDLLNQVDIEVIETTHEKLILKNFEIEFFHINHNIPDSMGIAIHTPVGTIVHTGDFKFDYTPLNEAPADFGKIASIGNRGVLLLCSDSTNALTPGHTISEARIAEKLEFIIRHATGRVIVSTFSTLINRIQQIIDIAQRYDRKVVVEGRSMIKSVEICRELGYIRAPENLFISPGKANQLPDEQVLFMTTGAQATKYSALVLASRKQHRQLEIREGDTVILSASVVPGNERAVEKLLDGLVRQGAQAFHHAFMGVHTTGHAQQEDLKLMLNLVRPKFFMPIMGWRHLLEGHAQLAREVGIPSPNIYVAQNGDVITFTKENMDVTGQIPAAPIYVDGLGIGDVGKAILREREQLSSHGMVVVVAVVDEKSHKLLLDPEVLTKGFIYRAESQDVLDQVTQIFRNTLSNLSTGKMTINELQNSLTSQINSHLHNATGRRPVVMVRLVPV
jgi:ribonuclease J